ncbi:MAG: hypothetical protein ACU837_13480 [Gammaproteobacteria bacterium]
METNIIIEKNINKRLEIEKISKRFRHDRFLVSALNGCITGDAEKVALKINAAIEMAVEVLNNWRKRR